MSTSLRSLLSGLPEDMQLYDGAQIRRPEQIISDLEGVKAVEYLDSLAYYSTTEGGYYSIVRQFPVRVDGELLLAEAQIFGGYWPRA